MTNEAFIVGSSLYRMSIQMLVAKAVLQYPDQYARILHNNVNGAKNFKKNPTVKGIKRFVTETIISESGGSISSKFKPSQLLAELEADDDEGPNTSKERSPTLSSDDDILDKVGIGKRKLVTAPLDENSDNESASQPKPPTLPTESNENEEAVIPRDKGLKRSIRSLSINLWLLQLANTLVFVLFCC
jgi:hypothetical protein